MRAGPDVELDGIEGVDKALASDNVASVTRRRSPRNRACRSRFERRPAGVLDHARFLALARSRRCSQAQSAQLAPTAAQAPQKT